ncbi:MAG: LysM peptidoglycan-binding domain-containing protein, partial [Thermoanaerobaculia bacterium]|nr:LysM peptidoglycan-binding domain-containing protein [Thermoanaerobaculia bacterium]
EAYGVIEATLERRPYHYHLAVFPRVFRERGEQVLGDDFMGEYFVLRGDTLSKIARRYATSVEMVKAVNGLKGTTIYPGQRLKIPTTGR